MLENLDAATMEHLEWQAYKAEVPEESNSGLELRRIFGSMPLDPVAGYPQSQALSDTVMPRHRIAKKAILRQESWNLEPNFDEGKPWTTQAGSSLGQIADFSPPTEPAFRGLGLQIKAKASVADSDISELLLDSETATMIDSEWSDIGSVLDRELIDREEAGVAGAIVTLDNQNRVHFKDSERPNSEPISTETTQT
ncbi:MAG: hypothetical protein MMC33_009333 [Icmadophila ericetorum]|nr:hypothetical protein [Icmadophila ericetorum]